METQHSRQYTPSEQRDLKPNVNKMCLPFFPRKSTTSPSDEIFRINAHPRTAEPGSFSSIGIIKKARPLLDASKPRGKKSKPDQPESLHRPPITAKAQDDKAQAPYYHEQTGHHRHLLDEANSEDGWFRLKQREQRLVAEHRICIRDFAFDRNRTAKADIQAEGEGEGETRAETEKEEKEEGHESEGLLKSRADSIASSTLAESPILCSLHPRQQQLVLDAWKRGSDMESLGEEQRSRAEYCGVGRNEDRNEYD